MKLAMIGLGRMGGNMVERLLQAGHALVVFDQQRETVDRFRQRGAEPCHSLTQLSSLLPPPRVLWMMIPAGQPVDTTIEALRPTLSPGDVIIDGGNSYYKDTLRRASDLRSDGIFLLDAGTSGGIWGRQEGYSLMIGGDADVVASCQSVFESLAPAAARGWAHVGPSGAGHFVKMVHNGIEYGLMQAYAEGFAILKKKSQFDLDLAKVASVWRHGSVVRSWLLDLTAAALDENPEMEGVAPFVEDSGEGRWTVSEAVDLDIPAPVITLSLMQRLRSRDSTAYYDRLLAAMRNQFGGHSVKKED